jgi:hypothetical protein
MRAPRPSSAVSSAPQLVAIVPRMEGVVAAALFERELTARADAAGWAEERERENLPVSHEPHPRAHCPELGP